MASHGQTPRKESDVSFIPMVAVPPGRTEAEQAVLGSLWIDNHALGLVSDLIASESLWYDQHRLLWDATVAIIQSAQPADELALDAQPLEHRADLRAAAVDHHRIYPDGLEQHDILGEIAHRLGIAHRVAAVFHHHDFLVVALHVGQGFRENAGDVVLDPFFGTGTTGAVAKKLGRPELAKIPRKPFGRPRKEIEALADVTARAFTAHMNTMRAAR